MPTTEDLSFSKALLREMRVLQENGVRDASIIDILDAVFCDIPDYLSNDVPDNNLNWNGSIVDASIALEIGDKIANSMSRSPQPDFDIVIDDDNKDTMEEVVRLKKTYPNPEDNEYKLNDELNDESNDEVNDDEDKDKDKKKDSSLPDREDLMDKEASANGGCKSAIIEFGCDTDECPAVEYKLKVKPGEQVNDRTIIGYIKQKHEWREIRSIFSQGTVRRDPRDGSYGRLYKPVCSRHIIIDCYELASQKSWDGVDMKNLMDHPKTLIKFQKMLEESEEALGLILLLCPYLMYLRLALETANWSAGDRSKLENVFDKDKSVKKIVFDDNGEERSLFTRDRDGWNIQNGEAVSRDKMHIKEAFNVWVNEAYHPRRQKFLDEIKEIYGGDDFNNIRATNGNPKKLRDLATEAFQCRERYIKDVIEMMKNPYFPLPIEAEGGDKDFEYTSKMTDEFGEFTFELLKTYLYGPVDTVRKDLETMNPAADTYDIKNPTDAEFEPSTTGDLLANTEREGIIPVKDENNFREYFKNLALSTQYGGITRIEQMLIDILNKFAKTHPKEGDAREDLKKELKELREFFGYLCEVAGGIPEANKSPEAARRITMADPEKDPFLIKLLEQVPPEAIWPWATDYEYRGFIYQKYTFPNIDCLEEKTKKSKDFDNNVTSDGDDTDYVEPSDSMNIESVVASLKDPEGSGDPGDIAAQYRNHSTEEGENLTVSDIELSDIDYWRRYLGIATIVGIVPAFWATGMIIPPIPYIPFPCIFIPIKVFSISKCGLEFVLGIAVRGVCVNLLLIVVNMSQQHNSLMFPATILLADVKDQVFSTVENILNLIPMISSGIKNMFKTNNIALLKENKKYDAENVGLRALRIPGKNTLIRDVKTELGIDTRQIVNRLEADVKGIVDDADLARESAKEKLRAINQETAAAYSDFASGFKSLYNQEKYDNDKRQQS